LPAADTASVKGMVLTIINYLRCRLYATFVDLESAYCDAWFNKNMELFSYSREVSFPCKAKNSSPLKDAVASAPSYRKHWDYRREFAESELAPEKAAPEAECRPHFPRAAALPPER
jgi:hypothetical protein